MGYILREEIPGIWFIDLGVDDEKEYTGSYIISSGNEIALIDVGPASTFHKVLSALDEIGLPYDNVKYIFATHVHLDHAGAVGNLIKSFPNAHVIAHSRALNHLIDPEDALWRASKQVLGFVADVFGKPEAVAKERILGFDRKEIFTVGKDSFEMIPTPGHASHHVCIFREQRRVVFSGDAAGIYIPSLDVQLPISTPPFKLNLALESIETMISLKPNKIAFTHFGVASNGVLRLKRYYNQLIEWYESINEIMHKKMKDQEEMLEFISKRDKDLLTFLQKSKGHKGLTRGLKSNLEGFIQLIADENENVQILDKYQN